MNNNNFVSIKLVNNKTGESIAEIAVKKGNVKVDYKDGSKPKLNCRAGLIVDCLGNMFEGMNDGDDKLLIENANDFLISLLVDKDGKIPDFYIDCDSQEGCEKDKNCAKA